MLCYQDGKLLTPTAVDPAWLRAESSALLWVDLCDPTPDEAAMLGGVFGFHELAVEDALAVSHHPKVESYGSYLYMILHGIDFQAAQHQFATIDADFFIGPNYLVTVRHGTARSVPYVLELCEKGAGHVMQEGPLSLAHRIIDKMVDHYRPEVDKLSEQLDRLEKRVFESPDPHLIRVMLGLKRDVASLRRVVLPQRDVLARLARREFSQVSEALAFRFRDVHDHLVRLNDEAMYFQDRITGLLEAHLSNVSNRLNQVMKVLTLITTVFMPLTVLTGIYGMNTPMPQFPGGPGAQFWWVMGLMTAVTFAMVWFFRSRKWL
jgi:magnesium transporter